MTAALVQLVTDNLAALIDFAVLLSILAGVYAVHWIRRLS